MASNQTANFGLNQWSAEDRVLREEFNADNAKIDAALDAAPRFSVGSYSGTGKSGAENSNNLTFEFPPKIVFIIENTTGLQPNMTMLISGQQRYGCFSGTQGGICTWSDNSVNWYSADDSNGPTYQFNISKRQYNYVALG